MYQINFTQPTHLHFIGIGGISMSAFAELLHTMGFSISGSDMKESSITKHLETIGIEILYGHDANNIPDNTSLVVYTAAIHPENPELIAAKERGIPTMERAEMVGQVMKNYKHAVAVSGTHGKTTTTSILSHIFLAAQLDPTISVGGILKGIGGNLRIGKSDKFITEACEYTNSFLKFYPTVGVILNIEEDHLDFFKDINDIRNSFRKFSELLPENGALIINKDITNYAEITSGLPCKVVTYSNNDSSADYYANHITYDERSCGSFDLIVNGVNKGRFTLNIVGKHNVSNALSAIAAAEIFDINMETIQKGFDDFSGTDRRFEKKGEKNGITIIDDYAHHPSEIQATLATAQNCSHKDLWCVFQPHTYTRTRAFLKDFAKSLSLADKIILTDIYAAREKDPGDISSLNLKEELEKLGKEVYYFSDFKDIETFILKKCMHGDLLITMGAGNVVEIGENLLK